MYDSEKATFINEAANQILGLLPREALDQEATIPQGYDLVLQLVDLGDRLVVGYYLVDHTTRLLFWMDEFDASIICGEIACVVSFSHLREN